MKLIKSTQDFVAAVRLMAISDCNKYIYIKTNCLKFYFEGNFVSIEVDSDNGKVCISFEDFRTNRKYVAQGNSILEALERHTIPDGVDLCSKIKTNWFDFKSKDLVYPFKSRLSAELDRLEYERPGRVSFTNNVVSLSVAPDGAISLGLNRYDSEMKFEGLFSLLKSADDFVDMPPGLDLISKKIFCYNLFSFCDGRKDRVVSNDLTYDAIEEMTSLQSQISVLSSSEITNEDWF